jgi:hypothetical protein
MTIKIIVIIIKMKMKIKMMKMINVICKMRIIMKKLAIKIITISFNLKHIFIGMK